MSAKFGDLKYELVKSNRKTLAIEIKQNRITVRAPFDINSNEIYSFLEKKKSWIENHILNVKAKQERLKDITPFTDKELSDLKEDTLKKIKPIIAHYANILGVDYSRVTVRCQKTRWGSCSSSGNLNFNCLISLLPVKVMNSIIVHELCHRKHMNHSKEFYNEIKKILPDYDNLDKWLKDNGYLFLGRLPK